MYPYFFWRGYVNGWDSRPQLNYIFYRTSILPLLLSHTYNNKCWFVDFISKVKDTAENVSQKLQETAESAGLAPSPRTQRKGGGPQGGSGRKPPRPPPPKLGQPEPVTSLVMQIAQLYVSLLHAWGLQPDLDKLCSSKLGLICPKRPVSFGLLSRGGHMSLLMPGWHKRLCAAQKQVRATI